MNEDFETWGGALQVALSRAKHSGKRHKITSSFRGHGWASCPSRRRWYVREVTA